MHKSTMKRVLAGVLLASGLSIGGAWAQSPVSFVKGSIDESDYECSGHTLTGSASQYTVSWTCSEQEEGDGNSFKAEDGDAPDNTGNHDLPLGVLQGVTVDPYGEEPTSAISDETAGDGFGDGDFLNGSPSIAIFGDPATLYFNAHPAENQAGTYVNTVAVTVEDRAPLTVTFSLVMTAENDPPEIIGPNPSKQSPITQTGARIRETLNQTLVLESESEAPVTVTVTANVGPKEDDGSVTLSYSAHKAAGEVVELTIDTTIATTMASGDTVAAGALIEPASLTAEVEVDFDFEAENPVTLRFTANDGSLGSTVQTVVVHPHPLLEVSLSLNTASSSTLVIVEDAPATTITLATISGSDEDLATVRFYGTVVGVSLHGDENSRSSGVSEWRDLLPDLEESFTVASSVGASVLLTVGAPASDAFGTVIGTVDITDSTVPDDSTKRRRVVVFTLHVNSVPDYTIPQPDALTIRAGGTEILTLVVNTDEPGDVEFDISVGTVFNVVNTDATNEGEGVFQVPYALTVAAGADNTDNTVLLTLRANNVGGRHTVPVMMSDGVRTISVNANISVEESNLMLVPDVSPGNRLSEGSAATILFTAREEILASDSVTLTYEGVPASIFDESTGTIELTVTDASGNTVSSGNEIAMERGEVITMHLLHQSGMGREYLSEPQTVSLNVTLSATTPISLSLPMTEEFVFEPWISVDVADAGELLQTITQVSPDANAPTRVFTLATGIRTVTANGYGPVQATFNAVSGAHALEGAEAQFSGGRVLVTFTVTPGQIGTVIGQVTLFRVNEEEGVSLTLQAPDVPRTTLIVEADPEIVTYTPRFDSQDNTAAQGGTGELTVRSAPIVLFLSEEYSTRTGVVVWQPQLIASSPLGIEATLSYQSETITLNSGNATASAGSDYATVSGPTITFANGELEPQVSFAVNSRDTGTVTVRVNGWVRAAQVSDGAMVSVTGSDTAMEASVIFEPFATFTPGGALAVTMEEVAAEDNVAVTFTVATNVNPSDVNVALNGGVVSVVDADGNPIASPEDSNLFAVSAGASGAAARLEENGNLLVETESLRPGASGMWMATVSLTTVATDGTTLTIDVGVVSLLVQRVIDPPTVTDPYFVQRDTDGNVSAAVATTLTLATVAIEPGGTLTGVASDAISAAPYASSDAGLEPTLAINGSVIEFTYTPSGYGTGTATGIWVIENVRLEYSAGENRLRTGDSGVLDLGDLTILMGEATAVVLPAIPEQDAGVTDTRPDRVVVSISAPGIDHVGYDATLGGIATTSIYATLGNEPVAMTLESATRFLAPGSEHTVVVTAIRAVLVPPNVSPAMVQSAPYTVVATIASPDFVTVQVTEEIDADTVTHFVRVADYYTDDSGEANLALCDPDNDDADDYTADEDGDGVPNIVEARLGTDCRHGDFVGSKDDRGTVNLTTAIDTGTTITATNIETSVPLGSYATCTSCTEITAYIARDNCATSIAVNRAGEIQCVAASEGDRLFLPISGQPSAMSVLAIDQNGNWILESMQPNMFPTIIPPVLLGPKQVIAERVRFIPAITGEGVDDEPANIEGTVTLTIVAYSSEDNTNRGVTFSPPGILHNAMAFSSPNFAGSTLGTPTAVLIAPGLWENRWTVVSTLQMDYSIVIDTDGEFATTTDRVIENGVLSSIVAVVVDRPLSSASVAVESNPIRVIFDGRPLEPGISDATYNAGSLTLNLASSTPLSEVTRTTPSGTRVSTTVVSIDASQSGSVSVTVVNRDGDQRVLVQRYTSNGTDVTPVLPEDKAHTLAASQPVRNDFGINIAPGPYALLANDDSNSYLANADSSDLSPLPGTLQGNVLDFELYPPGNVPSDALVTAVVGFGEAVTEENRAFVNKYMSVLGSWRPYSTGSGNGIYWGQVRHNKDLCPIISDPGDAGRDSVWSNEPRRGDRCLMVVLSNDSPNDDNTNDRIVSGGPVGVFLSDRPIIRPATGGGGGGGGGGAVSLMNLLALGLIVAAMFFIRRRRPA